MEKRLSPEEACRLIREDLGIDRSRVRPCFDEYGTRVCCLVHESWIQRCVTGGLISEWVSPVSPWSSYEHQLLLQPSHPGPTAPWLRITIQIVKKPSRKAKPVTESLSDVFANGLEDARWPGDLLFADLMQNVASLLYSHSWDNALERFPSAAFFGLLASQLKASDKSIIEGILLQAYNLPVKKLVPCTEDEEQSRKETDSFDEVKEQLESSSLLEVMKQNVVPIICALEGKTVYFLIEPYFQHSLQDMVTFSPSVLSGSHIRPLFVIYELLCALKWYHSHRMAHGALILEKVKVSKGLWIYLQGPEYVDFVSCDLNRYQLKENEDINHRPLQTDTVQYRLCKPQSHLTSSEFLASNWTYNDLPCLVQQWVNGELSNYDYLIALNYLAGRRLGDPNYHPVFPWVTDFSAPNGKYRDLTKSKFRLNKGDRQLDITYKAAWLDNQDGMSASVPHHVSDVLSDITYHVYLARRTPKSILCDHVRTHWVPNEYPSSMERLYHWTPDECIPQFFSDPTIFESIHSDLPDLEVPYWTASPDEFVQWHRDVLESETVSCNLHFWIDLTFGYKLGGKEAVKAKNVYLHLIDKHQSLNNHGVLQLFTQPHPEKLQLLPHASNSFLSGGVEQPLDGKLRTRTVLFDVTSHSKSLEESVTSIGSIGDGDMLMRDPVALSSKTSNESSQDGGSKQATIPSVKEGSSEEDGMKGAQFEPIQLPCNYNPLNLLQRFEALEKFKNQFGLRMKSMADSRNSQIVREMQFERLVQIDMASLGCVIVEMLLPEKVRLATAGLTGKEREKSIVRLCTANQKVLPRYARAGVWALLRELLSSMEEDRTSRDDEQINSWIPPLTADLLLQPHLGVFPFPAYFSALYEFLAAFYHSSRTLLSDSSDETHHMDWEWRSEDGAEYSLEQVVTAASFLPDLLAKVDDEGVKLLVYHLEPVFTCPKTRLLACTRLFDMLSQALGPKNTVKTFLKCLLSLFDSHSLENYESITRQHFLSQIIVRFGLEGFLKHFISFVVDAVAFKSMMDTEAQNGRRFSSFQTIEVGVPGFVAPDSSFSRKEPVLLDADVDLPENFLRGSPEDQEEELEYSISVDEVDGEFASDSLLGKRNVQDVDKVGSGEEEHTFDEQVTLLPRNDDFEEGDKMIFLHGIVLDDDDGPEASTRRPVHGFALESNNGSDGDVDGDLFKGFAGDDSHGIASGNGDSKKSDHTLVNDEGRKIGALDGGDIDDGDRSGNEDKQRGSASDTIGPRLEPIGKSTALSNHIKKELDFKAVDKEEDVEDPCKSVLEQVDGSAPSIGKHVEGVELGKEEYTQSETLYPHETDEREDILTKTLKRVGRDSQDDSRGIGREKEGRVGFSLEYLTIEGDEARSSKSSESREEIFESGKEVDNDNDDGEEDDDDDDDDKSGHQSGDMNTQPPVAYKVQTFYNDSKSKATRQEENGERDHSELTPGTISGIAAESIVWLAPRLGPVLTSKYIASQLLTMLPHCYIGHVGKADENDECVVNDRDAKWLLFCLGNFCTLYGEAFMLYQYLPYIKKTIKSVQNKITPRSEAALAGVLSLLKYCIPYLSRDTLCDYCESELMRGVFQPVIRILSSYTTVFPGGVTSRQAICRSYIDVLTVVCLKLERELARENMTAPLQQFFSCFELDRMRRISDGLEVDGLFKTIATDVENGVETKDALVRNDENDGTGADNDNTQKQEFEALYSSPVYDELCQTFSAAIAHHAFVPLCGIMGSKYMESSLYNHDLIWNLCCSHDAQLSHPTCEDTRASEDDVDGLPQEEGDGNIDQTFDGDRAAEEVDTAPKLHHEDKVGDEKIHGMSGIKKGIEKLKGKRKPPMWFIGRGFAKNKDGPSKFGRTPSSSSDQYLRGSWLEHWENQLSNKEKIGSSFVLQQVKLQTFTGHSGTVRSLYVQDSEHCFLSASKDKTVKLWSLSNHGDGTAQSASSWTYYRHSRPVFHVGMVESVRQAVSCDGSLHLWDPVSGRCLGIFEPTRNNPVVAMTTLPAPSQCVVAAMAEGTARFLDVRQHSFVQEWKVTTSTLAGTVRDICSSPDGRWIALGFSSGLASVLDIRGGLLRSQRRAHTSDIFQVKAFSNNSFVTSSVDQGLSLWKDDGLRMKNLRGHTDPLPSLLVWRDQVISASVSGKVGVHNLQDDQSEASYFSYKLTGDVFRGGITCLGYLPLNKLLLIGSDTGNISLCC